MACSYTGCSLLLFRSTARKSGKKKKVKVAKELVYKLKVINKEREKAAAIANGISTIKTTSTKCSTAYL